MKKIFFSFAVAAVALVACNKEDMKVSGPDVKSEPVTLTVGVEGAQTKAVGVVGDATDEAKINTLQVFVFNGEIIDGYGVVANDSKVTIGCTVGAREIYALVNVPDCKSVTTKSQLLALVSHLSNDVNDFEMIGRKNENITKETSSVSVAVDRFAARVVVKKITNALSSPALQNQKFTVKSIHLNNVADDLDYARTAGYAPTKWYNKGCYEAGNSLSLVTFDAIGTDLNPSASYTTAHYLYGYPNKAAFSSEATWAPRRTMLVLKIQIGARLYNYPILLPEFEYNKSYEIDEIQITRPGNVDDGTPGGSDEQVPVEGKDCVFNISVNPWTVVPVTNGTVI